MTTLAIPQTIGASDLRLRAREILDRFMFRDGAPLVIERWGQPIAVIMPLEQYADLTRTRADNQPAPTRE